MNRWSCQPCDHKWWEHREPDPDLRFLGQCMMGVGAVNIALALLFLLSR